MRIFKQELCAHLTDLLKSFVSLTSFFFTKAVQSVMRKQLAEIRKVQNMTAYWLIHVLCTALVLKKSEAHYLFISVGSHCS